MFGVVPVEGWLSVLRLSMPPIRVLLLLVLLVLLLPALLLPTLLLWPAREIVRRSFGAPYTAGYWDT